MVWPWKKEAPKPKDMYWRINVVLRSGRGWNINKSTSAEMHECFQELVTVMKSGRLLVLTDLCFRAEDIESIHEDPYER